MIKGIQPSLAEGGKIKIGELGEERTSRGGRKWRAPVKLDHFLITGTQRDEYGDLRIDEPLMAAMPADRDGLIRAIPIVVHSDSIDEVFPTSYAMYSGRKLACRGDGETATRWEFRDGARTSETKQCKCPCEYLNNRNGGPMCKPHGTLHCSIIAPNQAVAGAVHKWRTTSLISIQRMIGSLQQILATCGTMRGLPLWLKLEAIQVQPDGIGASTVYCCHVELRAADLLSVQRKALELAQMRNALSGGVDIDRAYRALITAPAGDHETPEEQAEVADEFYPEAAVDNESVADISNVAQLPERSAVLPDIASLRALVASAKTVEDLAAVERDLRRLSPRERESVTTLLRMKQTELGGCTQQELAKEPAPAKTDTKAKSETKPQGEAKKPAEKKPAVTLDDVLAAINKAGSIDALEKITAAARALTSADDKAKARAAYAAKKNALEEPAHDEHGEVQQQDDFDYGPPPLTDEDRRSWAGNDDEPGSRG